MTKSCEMTTSEIQELLTDVGLNKDHLLFRDHGPFDRLVIEPSGSGWCTFFAQRGQRDYERKFARQSNAVLNILGRMAGMDEYRADFVPRRSPEWLEQQRGF